MDWKPIFDRLGMNGTRWQWRMMKWERQLRTVFRAPLQGGGLSLSRLFIFVNVALFIWMVLRGLLAGQGLTPLIAPDPFLLLYAGGQYWPLVLQEGEWWRCLTYAFTHAGIIHLLFNMIVLFQVGPLIEFEIGRARFLLLYTLTALTATLAGYLWHPLVPVVGASGSLFGLIGFAAAWFHRLGDHQSRELRNFMLRWAAFAFVFGLLVGADNAGHLGGGIGGAVLGLLLPTNAWSRRKTDPLFNLLGGLCVTALVASFVLLVYSWLRA